MKLGARMLKTGIAIALALFLAHMLNLPSPVFAGISAVFAIQPSIYRSYLSIIEQAQANIIGAIIAVIFVLIFGNDPFIIGLTAIIVIAINLKLNLEKTISISLVTVIAIMASPTDNFIQFSFIRFSTIMLGILSAFFVNLIFLPPKYETKLYYNIVENTNEIIKWIRMSTRNASEHGFLKNDINKLKDNMIKLDQMYLLYKEERIYLRKHKYVKTRKLVLFRQMIIVTNRSLDTLKLLHRLENELRHMPKEFQSMIISELDCLLGFHEQILLKFIGKIKSQPTEDAKKEAHNGRYFLLQSFIKDFNAQNINDHLNHYQVLPLIGVIIDYYEQLLHLDHLIDSFQQYHKDENEFQIANKEDM
ncbi:aromatic acid exporter family protein [Bacillus sp. SM2101]|uniref:FUSC family protein n=1 Tax=Bacillus sp. SM2101 TaxID=2805366 RepID=UPI001BDE10B9|nr:aromatic acid exporter family protein [Bacillus sp. SM2101]